MINEPVASGLDETHEEARERIPSGYDPTVEANLFGRDRVRYSAICKAIDAMSRAGMDSLDCERYAAHVEARDQLVRRAQANIERNRRMTRKSQRGGDEQ